VSGSKNRCMTSFEACDIRRAMKMHTFKPVSRNVEKK
jgi:hypothetical protein